MPPGYFICIVYTDGAALLSNVGVRTSCKKGNENSMKCVTNLKKPCILKVNLFSLTHTKVCSVHCPLVISRFVPIPRDMVRILSGSLGV